MVSQVYLFAHELMLMRMQGFKYLRNNYWNWSDLGGFVLFTGLYVNKALEGWEPKR